MKVEGIGLNNNTGWGGNLTGTIHGSLAFGDLNRDNKTDMIISGCSTGWVSTCSNPLAKVYINNGTNLVENSTWQQNMTGVGWSSVSLGDINNDGKLDLVLSGYDSTEGVTKVYVNNGSTLLENSTWGGNLTDIYAYYGSVVLGDVNNDGKLDLALSGSNSTSCTANPNKNGIYINNGTAFVKNSTWLENLPPIRRGTDNVALGFVDINNDNKLDLIVMGSCYTNEYFQIYINNGTSLVENSTWEQNLLEKSEVSLAFGDYDNDGDTDMGAIGVGDSLIIYENNGTTFKINETEASQGYCCLGAYYAGSIAFGDYDNEGDLDLVGMGLEANGNYIYYNGPNIWNLTFNGDSNASIDLRTDNLQQGALAWQDINNDTKLDLAITGEKAGTGVYISAIYVSNNTVSNTQPNASASFSSSFANNLLTLTWGNGSDAETPANGLYYNLRVGTTSGGNEIVSGVYGGSSNPTAGYFGNMMQRKSISLSGSWLLPSTTYYWSVQTIDTGLMKSNWSAEQNYTTNTNINDPNVTLISPINLFNTTNASITFNASVTDDSGLANVSLWANWTGSWAINETNSTNLANGSYYFSKNLSNYGDGFYKWAVRACDTDSNCISSANRTILIDNASPDVSLVSPANAETWTSSSNVIFTYNVSDLAVANCSLIIDNVIIETDTGIAINASQTFSRNLNNAAYAWSINCTDFTGHMANSTTRSLTVNYVAPPSSSGGGGGGETTKKNATILQTKEFDIDFSGMSSGDSEILEFRHGDIKTFSFNGEIKHSITILALTADSATLLITSEPITLQIKSGETKQVDVNEDNINEIEIKLVSVIGEKAKFSFEKLPGADIAAKEELEEAIKKEALFDAKISISNLFKIVKSGGKVVASVELFNVNKIGKVDVKIDYYITSKEDNATKLAEGSDTLAVEAVTSFIRSLNVPHNTNSGDYLFNVNVIYNGRIIASSSAEFKVIKSYEIFFVVGMAFLIAACLAFYLWRIREKEVELEKEGGRLRKKEEELAKEVKGIERILPKNWKRKKFLF